MQITKKPNSKLHEWVLFTRTFPLLPKENFVDYFIKASCLTIIRSCSPYFTLHSSYEAIKNWRQIIRNLQPHIFNRGTVQYKSFQMLLNVQNLIPEGLIKRLVEGKF